VSILQRRCRIALRDGLPHDGATVGFDEGQAFRQFATVDPEERLELLLRDLRTSRTGLSRREAARRLVQFGPNLLERRHRRRWLPELAHQLTHPLALLLWAAAGLAWIAGIVAVAVAIVIVILVNAAFASPPIRP
jgi:magnesium-transporting ATPase (P-type)